MKEENRQPERNGRPEFAGVGRIKAEQERQLGLFEGWAKAGDWGQFHDSHYDWWMFPIDRRSARGYIWTVYPGDVAELKQDEAFVRRYLRGVELLMASWGWDLRRQAPLPDPQPGQAWRHWPVRLYKAAASLRLFGFEEQFASLKKYAEVLMRQGEPMTYGGHDLSWLFTTGIEPGRKDRS